MRLKAARPRSLGGTRPKHAPSTRAGRIRVSAPSPVSTPTQSRASAPWNRVEKSSKHARSGANTALTSATTKPTGPARRSSSEPTGRQPVKHRFSSDSKSVEPQEEYSNCRLRETSTHWFYPVRPANKAGLFFT